MTKTIDVTMGSVIPPYPPQSVQASPSILSNLFDALPDGRAKLRMEKGRRKANKSPDDGSGGEDNDDGDDGDNGNGSNGGYLYSTGTRTSKKKRAAKWRFKMKVEAPDTYDGRVANATTVWWIAVRH